MSGEVVFARHSRLWGFSVERTHPALAFTELRVGQGRWALKKPLITTMMSAMKEKFKGP